VLANISALGLSFDQLRRPPPQQASRRRRPGIAFGDDRTVRFSYATSMDIIKKGLDRFEEFCKDAVEKRPQNSATRRQLV
jgi:aspartate aminotransferase